ncbi:MAG: hypothetical protein A3K31_06260 [Ignavibacteria bacterium RIFOXYA12_FULL_35_25]|nr:MAG: hypothetical protein A2X60_07855 [Ignavibacteria bacterium GWF2_35_20]OGU79539.1 MAG: hypothetical protein A2254_04200 [Ignavibacteria bacterium RIFOXYA2_FULL_35_9]OGU87267.1 MAG: hypothetical protein A3K31_06260 [Ignavibacteria bacterium RIFOXYA12_FULL_35_25]HAB53531.1 hypothetical protein [Ignavibacteriales bacterium]
MIRLVLFLILNSSLLTLNCYSKQIGWVYIAQNNSGYSLFHNLSDVYLSNIGQDDDDRNINRLRICEKDFPIQTNNKTKPTERQLENIKNILTDDFLVNEDTTIANIEHKYPSIAMDGTGNFVIAWMDYRSGNNDIYFQRYSSNGTVLGVNTKVNDDAGTAGQAYPSIAMDGIGNFVIAWIDARNSSDDIYYQRYNSIGIAQGVNAKANDDAGTAYQEYPSITMDGSGNFIIAWEDFRNGNWNIYYQRYNSIGITQGVNVKANDDLGTTSQYAPSIALDGIGNFVIAWHDYRNNNYDIYYQRYNSIGIAQGVNTKVNDDAEANGQYDASIAMDDVGNFVIAWDDNRNNNYDIYYQRYNSIGIAQGINTKVNNDTGTDGQYYPSIAMDGVGNFVIVWLDNRYVLYKPDVIGQRFYSNGSPWGINYRIVADGINHGETFPVVVANANQIIFSWMDNRRTMLWDIYGKVVGWNWDGVTSVLSAKKIPIEFALEQNYPNPFNPSTVIKFGIPERTNVLIKIYDLLGNEVTALLNQEMDAGWYELEFQSALGNKPLASGIYFYQLKAGNFVQTRKMILSK